MVAVSSRLPRIGLKTRAVPPGGPALTDLDGFLHLSLFCPIRNPGVNEPQRKSKGDDGVDYGRGGGQLLCP